MGRWGGRRAHGKVNEANRGARFLHPADSREKKKAGGMDRIVETHNFGWAGPFGQVFGLLFDMAVNTLVGWVGW